MTRWENDYDSPAIRELSGQTTKEWSGPLVKRLSLSADEPTLLGETSCAVEVVLLPLEQPSVIADCLESRRTSCSHGNLEGTVQDGVSSVVDQGEAVISLGSEREETQPAHAKNHLSTFQAFLSGSLSCARPCVLSWKIIYVLARDTSSRGNMSQEKTDRRTYLKIAGGTVLGLAVGAAAGYMAKPEVAPVGPGVVSTVTQTVTATAAPPPTKKETFVQVEQHDPGEADPAKWVNFVSCWSFTHVYDALSAWGPGTEGNSGTPSLMPMLARRFQISQDKKTYVFYLREGVRFHDGSLMTADDVVYTLKRMLTINFYPVSLYLDVLPQDNIEKLDKYTVRATLTKSFPLFIQATPFMFILNSKVIEANIKKPGPYGDKGDYATEWLQTHDAGAGPYSITERVIGDHVTYARFPDYWAGWKSRYFDEAIYKVVNEAATQAQMLRTGEADRIGAWLPVDLYYRLSQESGPWKVDVDIPLEFYLCINYNNQAKGLDDVHVRRALSYCFDYDKCVNQIFHGWVERLEGPVPKGVKYFNPDVQFAYNFDLAKAKDELAKSAYKPEELEFDYIALAAEEHRKLMGQLLADGASQIGIKINIKELPYSVTQQMYESVETAGPSMVAMIPMSTYPDPDNYLYYGYHSRFWKGKKGTYATQVFVDNPKVNDLLDKARYEADDAKRGEMYYEIQSILVDQATTLWAIKGEPHFNAMRSDVAGYEWWPFGTPPSYMPHRWHKYFRLRAEEM